MNLPCAFKSVLGRSILHYSPPPPPQKKKKNSATNINQKNILIQ